MKMLEFYQEKITVYALEIEHSKTDKHLTEEEKKEKISVFVENEHKFVRKINKFIQQLKIVANCTA